MKLFKQLRPWTPPAIEMALRPFLRKSVYFKGLYSDWESAKAKSTGYDAKNIVERVERSMLQVKNGTARAERDSVLLDCVDYPFPLLATLCRAAIEDSRQLKILDFGGSLGSTYYKCRDFLPILDDLKWAIVEQPSFVLIGRKTFANNVLLFFDTIADATAHFSPNVFLFSSVLQYLERPYEVLEEAARENPSYIVIDRTPISENAHDAISVQNVPNWIYRASYPCRIFGRHNIQRCFEGRYELLAEFEAADGAACADNLPFSFRGLILCRKGLSKLSE